MAKRIGLLVLALLVAGSLLTPTTNALSTCTQPVKTSARVAKVRPKEEHPPHQGHRSYATFVVTAYTANDAGMNGQGITASGKPAIAWHTVAASDRWSYGTQFKTPDGQIWTVADRGGAITDSNRLDLYVGRHDVQTALDWGVKTVRVQILREGNASGRHG